MVNNTDVYKRAAQDFLRMGGQKAYAALERAINRAEHCLQTARSTAYDAEKVDSIDSFLSFFSHGLPDVLYHAPVTSHNWLVQNYGPTFTLGLTDPQPRMGVLFESKPAIQTPTQAEMGVLSRDQPTDLLLETYEAALARQLIAPPRGFGIQFERYADTGYILPQNVHKKAVVRIRLI